MARPSNPAASVASSGNSGPTTDGSFTDNPWKTSKVWDEDKTPGTPRSDADFDGIFSRHRLFRDVKGNWALPSTTDFVTGKAGAGSAQRLRQALRRVENEPLRQMASPAGLLRMRYLTLAALDPYLSESDRFKPRNNAEKSWFNAAQNAWEDICEHSELADYRVRRYSVEQMVKMHNHSLKLCKLLDKNHKTAFFANSEKIDLPKRTSREEEAPAWFRIPEYKSVKQFYGRFGQPDCFCLEEKLTADGLSVEVVRRRRPTILQYGGRVLDFAAKNAQNEAGFVALLVGGSLISAFQAFHKPYRNALSAHDAQRFQLGNALSDYLKTQRQQHERMPRPVEQRAQSAEETTEPTLQEDHRHEPEPSMEDLRQEETFSPPDPSPNQFETPPEADPRSNPYAPKQAGIWQIALPHSNGEIVEVDLETPSGLFKIRSPGSAKSTTNEQVDHGLDATL